MMWSIDVGDNVLIHSKPKLATPIDVESIRTWAFPLATIRDKDGDWTQQMVRGNARENMMQYVTDVGLARSKRPVNTLKVVYHVLTTEVDWHADMMDSRCVLIPLRNTQFCNLHVQSPRNDSTSSATLDPNRVYWFNDHNRHSLTLSDQYCGEVIEFITVGKH